jgi:hypothetical protein
MFLVAGLTTGEHSRDTDELLEVFELPFLGCMLMAQRGETTDSKTLLTLFRAEKYLKQLHD